MSDLFGGGEDRDSPAEPTPRRESNIDGAPRPLAERARPARLEDLLGQESLVGPDAPLGRLIRAGRLPSIILWGPPGSGKTTLAGLLAQHTQADFIPLSATSSGIKDVRAVADLAKSNRRFGRTTLLFIDEIHRFNKAQQDALLPHVESGLLTLVGATTENPSFSVISPLLSRCRVYVLGALREEDLVALLERGLGLLNGERGAEPLAATPEALRAIAALSDGDGRRALGTLEVAAEIHRTRAGGGPITADHVRDAIQRHFIYDRAGEEHFNLISALHKTMRSSDPHAAVYWLTRMLQAGEDPRYVARRMVRFAAEDIGLAEPNALLLAMEALRAYEALGSPEGEIALVQCCLYLAMAPKSNAVYRAQKAAQAEVERSGSLPVPLQIRNAPTGLMKDLGYGAGYTYDHDAEGGFAAKDGLPAEIADAKFYDPGPQGWEGRRRDELAAWDAARAKRRDGNRGLGPGGGVSPP